MKDLFDVGVIESDIIIVRRATSSQNPHALHNLVTLFVLKRQRRWTKSAREAFEVVKSSEMTGLEDFVVVGGEEAVVDREKINVKLQGDVVPGTVCCLKFEFGERRRKEGARV